MAAFLVIRAIVADPAKRAAFDDWYRREHLKVFGAEKAWRFWSDTDPSAHQARRQGPPGGITTSCGAPADGRCGASTKKRSPVDRKAPRWSAGRRASLRQRGAAPSGVRETRKRLSALRSPRGRGEGKTGEPGARTKIRAAERWLGGADGVVAFAPRARRLQD
jgi:hypothetical protein